MIDKARETGWGSMTFARKKKYRLLRFTRVSVAILLLAALAMAQQNAARVVPTLVRFGGVLSQTSGQAMSGTVGVTFSLYNDQQGGAPLWFETQNVVPDRTGRYTVQLGASKPQGLPTELFISGEARWLGVRPEGQAEQPRVLLLSVPYALKAEDAATLGGLPPSAFMLAQPAAAASDANGNTLSPSVIVPNSTQVPGSVTGTGTLNFIPLWTSSSSVGSSTIFQSGSGTASKVGINTVTPSATLDVKGSTTLEGLLSLRDKAPEARLTSSHLLFGSLTRGDVDERPHCSAHFSLTI